MLDDREKRLSLAFRQPVQKLALHLRSGRQDFLQRRKPGFGQGNLDEAGIRLAALFLDEVSFLQPPDRAADARLFEVRKDLDVANRRFAEASEVHQHPPFRHR